VIRFDTHPTTGPVSSKRVLLPLPGKVSSWSVRVSNRGVEGRRITAQLRPLDSTDVGYRDVGRDTLPACPCQTWVLSSAGDGQLQPGTLLRHSFHYIAEPVKIQTLGRSLGLFWKLVKRPFCIARFDCNLAQQLHLILAAACVGYSVQNLKLPNVELVLETATRLWSMGFCARASDVFVQAHRVRVVTVKCILIIGCWKF
jgi:hypothetical protein